MLINHLLSLALSLGLTLLFEIGFALILGLRKPKDLLLVFLVNVLTNPPLVLFLNLFSLRHEVPWYLILTLETAVVLTEGFLYRKRLEYTRISPFLLSFILNFISYTGGLIIS